MASDALPNESANPRRPWPCAGCGQSNDSSRDLCWQCGRPRGVAPEADGPAPSEAESVATEPQAEAAGTPPDPWSPPQFTILALLGLTAAVAGFLAIARVCGLASALVAAVSVPLIVATSRWTAESDVALRAWVIGLEVLLFVVFFVNGLGPPR